MSLERVLVQRATPEILRAKAVEYIDDEVRKGCTGELSPIPVGLEPPLRRVGDGFTPDTQREAENEDVRRYEIYVARDHSLDWNASELLIRHLQSARTRVGFEIVGNENQLRLYITSAESSCALVQAAFSGVFESVRLAPVDGTPAARIPAQRWPKIRVRDYYPAPPYYYLLTCPEELKLSPLETFLSAITTLSTGVLGIYQVLFFPATPAWRTNVERLADLEYLACLFSNPAAPTQLPQQVPTGSLAKLANQVGEKAHNDRPLFFAAVRIGVLGEDVTIDQIDAAGACMNLFLHGGHPLLHNDESDYESMDLESLFFAGRTYRPGFLVNSWELAGLVHVPTFERFFERRVPFSELERLSPCVDLSQGTPIGRCIQGVSEQMICIPPMLRHEHVHIVGKPGCGKSTLIEHMALSEIARGEGVAVIDPHGDLVTRLLGLIEDDAIDRVIYFNLEDADWVPLWNPLLVESASERARLADNLVAVFKRIVRDWGDRLEHVLRNAFFSVLHLRDPTLQNVYDLLRRRSPESTKLIGKVLEVVEDRNVRNFWTKDFARYREPDLTPPLHKVIKVLRDATAARMLSQSESRLDLGDVMDHGFILLADLSGLGTDVRDLLGSLLLSLFHVAALSRHHVPPDERRPFHIYGDEAHRFVSGTIEDLLAETRKYKVSLTLAHQYLSQFERRTVDALASVATTIVFNVDEYDAERSLKQFRGKVTLNDVLNLERGNAITRVGNEIVRIVTDEPRTARSNDQRETIIANSRRRYYRHWVEERSCPSKPKRPAGGAEYDEL